MFFAWYSCKLKVEQKTGWMSKNFAAALKKRCELLLNYSCVLAAVYLDPRYQLLLGNFEKELAKICIQQVFTLRENIICQKNVDQSPQSKISSDDKFDTVLEQLDKRALSPGKKIKGIINSFAIVKRLSKTSNVLKFWENHSEIELKAIANIVLAAPATQVSGKIVFHS
uniref:HAT C-terminal dimerisation domain-containing protein n=1 Tax=Bactrocera latifrons TaxID=174628 RepID=A0A0K8USQ7_BACLA